MEQQTRVTAVNAAEGLIERRKALTSAINAHDIEGIKHFIHPSYEAKGSLGLTWRFEDLLGLAEMSFKAAKDFRETVEIESVEPAGEAMLLTTTRRDNYTLFWFLKKREDTRQVETWKCFDGKWMLVGEKLLGQHADLSFYRSVG